jgi:hypothetical protein
MDSSALVIQVKMTLEGSFSCLELGKTSRFLTLHLGESQMDKVWLPLLLWELKVPTVSDAAAFLILIIIWLMRLSTSSKVGTRFMCTEEAEIHQNVKDVMVKADERNTVRQVVFAGACCSELNHHPDTHLPHSEEHRKSIQVREFAEERGALHAYLCLFAGTKSP